MKWLERISLSLSVKDYLYAKEAVDRGEREIPSSTRGTLNDAEHRTLGIAVRRGEKSLATGFNKLKLNKVM